MKENAEKKRTALSSFVLSEPFQVFVLLAAGLLLRVFMLSRQFAASFDEVHYLQLAASAAAGGAIDALHVFWTPLYPLASALTARIVPDIETAARVFSLICGMSLGGILYWFSRRFYGRNSALFTLLWAMLLPSLAFTQTTALTEPLYMLLSVSGMLAGWFVLRSSHWLWSGCVGLLFALAYLTRPEGAGFILIFCLLSLILAVCGLKNRQAGRYVLITLFSGFIFLLVSLPYLLFLRNAAGYWTPSGKTAIQQGALYGENRGEDEVDVYRDLSDDNTTLLIDHVFHDGVVTHIEGGTERPSVAVTMSGLVKKYLGNLYRVLKTGLPSALTAVLFMVTVLGLLGRVWDRKRLLRESYLLLFLFFYWFLLIPAFFVTERYLIALLPVCFLWAGQGTALFKEWTASTLQNSGIGQRPSLAAGMLVGLMLLCGSFLPEFGKYASRQKWSADRWAPPVEQKQAGLWLKAHSSSVPRIMSRYHTVNFYAGNMDITSATDIPLNSIDRVYAYARYRDIEYLVINERYLADNPNMVPLFYRTDVPEYLTLIYDETPGPGLRTLIYRFLEMRGDGQAEGSGR